MLGRIVVIALVPLLLAAGPAPSPPPPLAQARGDLDGDGRAERVHLERDGALIVDGADGRPRARVSLADKAPIVRGAVAIVAVEGHPVVHARADLGRGRAVEAVLGGGGKDTIFLGRTGPVGDGERSIKLRVDEAGVVRYQTAAGFSRCDGDEMLFPERWDFASGRFRPVTDEPPPGTKLRATTTTPAGLGGPPLGLFRFMAASTDATGDRRADQLAAPAELGDGNPATVWHAGYGAAARGAWATARTQAGAPRVRALEIVAGKDAPKSLALILGPSSDQQFSVEIAPGTQWVALPELLPTTCVSVAVAEPNARDNTLGEVRVYTDVDGPAGLERLANDVAEMKPNADGAAHLLGERGVEAARVIATVLPTAHGLGKRRLLQVLASIGADESAPALGKALETAEPADRPLLVDALAKMGAAGAREAIRIYGDDSEATEARADAALVLGRLPHERAAVDALVAGAGQGPAPVRAATMLSLSRVYADADGAIEKALTDDGGEVRTGDLARALGLAATRVGARPEMAPALSAAWARAKTGGFAVKLRVVRAMGDVGDGALAGALAEAARDPEPAVRAAAVASAARVVGAAATVRAGASDADAGVRKAALASLAAGGARPDAVELGARALGGDAWPMVRHAAADALAVACRDHADARAPLTRAVVGTDKKLAGADPSEEVRRASLAALGHCAGVPLGTFAGVLADKRQPVAVRELAAALVARHGGADAAKALAATVDDVLGDPNATDESVGIAAACTRALARVGDTSHPVLVALGEAANEPLSPSVRAAAMETIGQLCPDGAAPALKKGTGDPDASVRAAAHAALSRCKR